MEYKFTVDWFSPHIPKWEEWLGKYKDQPACFCEIGSYEGRSAVWLCDNILTHPESILACIEPFHPYRDADHKRVRRWFLSNTEQHRNDKRLWHYPEYSWHFLAPMRDAFDVIYIDGDHSVKGVATDAVLSWRALKPGGRIIFDDYLWPKHGYAVKTAVDAYLSCIEGKYTLIGQGYQVCIEKGVNAS